MAEKMGVDIWRDPVDAVVLGMGPGGEEVAGRLADAGLDVVGVDERLLGGECPYFGCIPTKAMVRSADLLGEAWRIPGMAGTVMVTPSWTPVARRVREVTADWSDKAAVERFTARGGRFLRGHGRITAPGEVTVSDADGQETVLRPARAIVLGTGGRPVVPPVPGLAGTPYWTTREAVAAERVPRSLCVLGGGSAGLELAQVYARFGADVTVLEAAPRLLPGEEPEAGELLLRVLTGQGLTVRAGTAAIGVGYDGTSFGIDTDRGDRVVAERLLVAAGREVDVTGTGIGALGLPDADGGTPAAVPVDDRMRVLPPLGARPGVWAVGDAVGRGGYTHQAVAQADVVVRGILGEGGPPASDRAVPRVTFTDPEVGAVGLTEAAAEARGLRVRAAVVELGPEARGTVWGPGGEGFVKVVADRAAGVLVGGTAAGPAGGEVVGALTLAVHAGVPVTELARVVWAFPTFHRALGAAVRML